LRFRLPPVTLPSEVVCVVPDGFETTGCCAAAFAAASFSSATLFASAAAYASVCAAVTAALGSGVTAPLTAFKVLSAAALTALKKSIISYPLLFCV
jgi:hypothetical protein